MLGWVRTCQDESRGPYNVWEYRPIDLPEVPQHQSLVHLFTFERRDPSFSRL